MPVKFLRVFKTNSILSLKGIVCPNQCFLVLSASLLASPGTTFVVRVPHPSVSPGQEEQWLEAAT